MTNINRTEPNVTLLEETIRAYINDQYPSFTVMFVEIRHNKFVSIGIVDDMDRYLGCIDMNIDSQEMFTWYGNKHMLVTFTYANVLQQLGNMISRHLMA